MKPKKKNQAKVIESNSVNYTFVNDVNPQTKSKEQESNKGKINKFTRKTLKYSKAKRTHYKFNSRSPKSQQGHSPVYE